MLILNSSNFGMKRRQYQMYIGLIIICVLSIIQKNALGQNQSTVKVQSQIVFPSVSDVSLTGTLGDALISSRKGRLKALPEWNNGELIKMFSSESKAAQDKMDWYGEHGGKWLYTTAIAVKQSGDAELKSLLLKTADYLASTQEKDGYLGSYSPGIRITSKSVSHKRSWDTWGLSYTALGFMEVNKYFPDEKYKKVAIGIGELFLNTFGDGTNDITDYGTRHGVSATVLLDPVVELYKLTQDKRYLDFAELILKKMEANEGARLISVPTNGGDLENVGDGKIYQLLWNLTALTKLYEVTAKPEYLKAIEMAWKNVVDYHLSIAGGPWGGVGKHKECFNSKNYWSPYGYVETCSTMSWIQLNKELLRLIGDAKYAQEIEKSAYNALLAARFPNGTDWSYHSFTNGSRHIAHFNDCCPSSGALALEELISIVYGQRENGIVCNLYTNSEATIVLKSSNKVHITQQTQYPTDGKIILTVSSTKSENFPVFIRIPDWASTVNISVNGKPIDSGLAKSGEFFALRQAWRKGDRIEVNFPMEITVHKKLENSDAPQGGKSIYNVSWFALTKGPLVFAATGLIDGKDREHTFQLTGDLKSYFIEEGNSGLQYQFKGDTKQPMIFVPYYRADNQQAGAWRLTWLQNKID